MSEVGEEIPCIRATYPFVAVPRSPDEHRLMFVERMDGIEAHTRSMYGVAGIMIAGTLLAVISVFVGVAARVGIFRLAAGIVLGPVLAIWAIRLARKRRGPRLTLAIDVNRGKSGIQWRDADGKLQSIEGPISNESLQLRRCDCEGVRVGDGLFWRVRGSGETKLFPLALATDPELLAKYADFVFGPGGITAQRVDMPIQITRPAPARRIGRSMDLLSGVVNCSRCKYDLKGIASPLCPECGTKRGFVPPSSSRRTTAVS